MTTTLPTDETTGRPVWHGLPVPWIVRWTGETADKPLYAVRVGGEGIQLGRFSYPPRTTMLTLNGPRYPFGIAAGLRADRDELGLLWYSTMPNAQDTGEPEFATLHSARTRACMLEGRCQVCGRPFGQRPVTFLDSATVLDQATGQHHRVQPTGTTMLTTTAPTCRTCAAVAMRLCPAQRRTERVLVTAHHYEPYSVLGDVYGVNERRELFEVSKGALVDITDQDTLAMTVVKQVCVEITDYTQEEFTG